MQLIINIILQGILPLVLGTYLVLLAQDKIKPASIEKAEKLANQRTRVEIIGWLLIVGGLLGLLIEII
jgi:hypothetical protein